MIENIERQIEEEQSGFREERSCADQIFVLRQICEEIKEKKKKSVCGIYGSREGV